MNNYFTIKQAAEIVEMTSETLRHYDRIGLVKPCHKDELSGYRYYSEQELVKLQTIELLKAMDLTLMDIKDILQQNDLSKVIDFLKQAEKEQTIKLLVCSMQNRKLNVPIYIMKISSTTIIVKVKITLSDT